MSIISEGIAACSKCGHRQNISVYKSINTSENPELKEKVIDGSIFLWECSECSMVNLTKYETLYHDPENKLMVWLIHDDNISEAQMQAISLHAKAIGNYTLRIVEDMGGLMEKVLIHNAKLDDVTIEMCKYITKMELASKMSEEQAQALWSTPFHFYKSDEVEGEQTITFMYADSLSEEKRMIGANVGINVYQDCQAILERNPNARPGDSFEKVDSTWILSKIK